MDNTNIEDIIKEIRSDICKMPQKKAAYENEGLLSSDRFDDANEGEEYRLQREKYEVFEHLNHEYTLIDYQDMGSGIKGAVKKAIQKAVRLITVPLATQQSTFNSHSVHAMNMMRKEEDILRTRIELQEQTLAEYQSQLNRIVDTLSKMSVESKRVQVVTQVPEGAATSATVASVDYYEDLDYLKFQNEFRGNPDDIKNRMRIYEPYFRDAKSTVLDFGCGRGEFLQLLQEWGVPAVGVDSYNAYETMGELKGLNIITADAVKYLQDATEPFGGIFVGQVVEHIGFPNIVKLCKLAYEKIEEGGYLVMETPNAACLAIYTNSFYLDPTHQTPVHPLLLQYVAKEAGFSSVEIVYTEGSRCDISIPEIRSEAIDNLEELNNALHRVSETLFGSMDYAIVARK